jgi:hypothetical protein
VQASFDRRMWLLANAYELMRTFGLT